MSRAVPLGGERAQPKPVLHGVGDVALAGSYVAGDCTFCTYLATGEDMVRKRPEISGFPADRIIEVNKIIDPTTAKH